MMASTDDETKYYFSFLLLHGDEPSEGTAGEFTTASGVTDEIMIEFARAFRDLPWADGINTQISLEKQDISTTSSTADLDTGTAWLSTAFTSVYYALFRLAEQHLGKSWGWFLGLAKPPTYKGGV